MKIILYVFLASFLVLTACQTGNSKIELEDARATIKRYLSSLYTGDYEAFDKSSYTHSERLKKKIFTSLLLARQCNIFLTDRFGNGAVGDFNLYKQSPGGISEIPLSIDFSQIETLDFRTWNGLYGIYDPQTATFFEFKQYRGNVLIDLEHNIINIEKYSTSIDRTIELMENVLESLQAHENKDISIKEFSEKFSST